MSGIVRADRPYRVRVTSACAIHGDTHFLHTRGASIVDACDRPVRLRAVNWYGFESNDFVAGGLGQRSYRAIIATIKRLGFNTLRLPFSNEMVQRNPIVSALTRVCPQEAPPSACIPVNGRHLLAANPDLQGRTALQILKIIVDYAGTQGLYVVLDNHRSRAGWGPQENGLWYDGAHGYAPSSWLADWRKVVRLFAGDPALTGVDLFNEPHSLGRPRNCANYLTGHGASWGSCDGRRNPATDWRSAAETGGNALLTLNPYLLIVVEGTSIAPGRTGVAPFVAAAGGNLMAAAEQPIRLHMPHRLVYSVHEYYELNRDADISVASMWRRWTLLFGYLMNLALPHSTPVWIGEFGTCANKPYYLKECVAPSNIERYGACVPVLVPDPAHPGRFVIPRHARKIRVTKVHLHSYGYWFDAFMRYLNTPPYPSAPPFGWAYWPLNGTTSDAYDFTHRTWMWYGGLTESFGLLDRTWRKLSLPALQQALISRNLQGLPPAPISARTNASRC